MDHYFYVFNNYRSLAERDCFAPEAINLSPLALQKVEDYLPEIKRHFSLNVDIPQDFLRDGFLKKLLAGGKIKSCLWDYLRYVIKALEYFEGSRISAL